MNDFETRLATALRRQIEEIAMNVDMSTGTSEFDARLDRSDRHRTRVVWLGVAAAAVVVLLLALGVRATTSATSTPPAAPPAAPDFTSSTFEVPFAADLPTWVTTSHQQPDSEQPEWVTWNRCPDPATECVGLSVNRYTSVPKASGGRAPVTPAGYLAYLDALAAAGTLRITDRSTTTVGGRPATVLSITAVTDDELGVGCHADGSCDDFFADVPGRYAVVDTGALDPDGEVLVAWTRAGALTPAADGWLVDFDAMLRSWRFTG